MCVLPVPLGPRAMAFSRRSIHSQRASSSTCILLSFGMALNIAVVIFLGLVLGLRLAASIAWEREHRTLEVLIAGPVSFEAVVLAKFLVELCVLLALMA